MANAIFLSPHCDDETLFGAYTIMAVDPLVIIPAADEERMDESVMAMDILGAGVIFLKDIKEIAAIHDVDVVYAPALEGGHPDHDALSLLAKDLFGDRVVYYSTYRGTGDIQPKGSIKVPHTHEMAVKKLAALQCYRSQYARWPEIFDLECKDEYYV